MPSDPYCGNCHTWMKPRLVAHGEVERWYCECPFGQAMGKDPNCHNSNHSHHDPQSPIVLSRKAEYVAEEKAERAEEDEVRKTRGEIEALITEESVYSAADGGPDSEGTICGHERLDGRCNFWGCPIRRAKAAAHVVHTGSPCEECGALITDEPEKGFVARDGPTDRPGSLFTDHPYHVAVFNSTTGKLLGWRPLDEPKIDEATRAELDAILRETNEQIEEE